MKQLLLNPGPVTLSQRVRKAMLQPDLCHREPEFSHLQDRIREKLLNVYALPDKDWAAVMLTGSGTAAVEAMLTSLVPEDGKLLIIENGVYGERMTKMAGIYGIKHERLHHPWGKKIDLEALESNLAKGDYTHIAVVHHETTTGRLNPLAEISTLCKSYRVQILLDSVSSYGAERLDFSDWPVAGCAATANKCLHGVPGCCFVIVNRNAVGSETARRTLYLDLGEYLKQQDAGGTPYTQSVQCFYALDAALDEMEAAGGQLQRQRTYLGHMQIIRDGLLALGIKPLMDVSESSCVLHAYYLPTGFSYERLHDALKAAGFIIYAGQGDLAKTLFRVSAMGDISKEDMQRLVAVFAELLG